MTHLSKFLVVVTLLGRLAVTAADSPWQRIVVIGASASSGFVLSEPFGGTNTDQCRLSHYLDAAIIAPHEPLKNLASPMLFLSPEAIARQEVEACTNRRPSLVVAVDFLFWFCHGEGRTDADRAARFEHGLKMLETIPGPLLVGDIPDASIATNSGILSPAQVAGETARTAANTRLRAWAAARPNVIIVPLAGFMDAVKSNAPITGRNISVPAGKTYHLLQPDRLHPNPAGAALLSLGILDAYVKTHPELAGEIRWNLDEVRQQGSHAALAAKNLLVGSAGF